MQRIADAAFEHFGGFDTWINNAGVSVFGKLLDVDIEDMRQVFETNFWGLVYGSLIAAKHLRHRGGALINVGSTLSDRAIPLQGIYSASKHAVKAFTDALRMELEHDGAPVSVTLIKPDAINTPYAEHAKNYMEVKPKHEPPVYAPDVVAQAILYACEHPERDVYVGASSKMLSIFDKYAPRLADKYMERAMFKAQKSDKPPLPRKANGLEHASGDLQERGDYEGRVAESSLYTKASLHPLATAAIVLGAGLTIASLWRTASGNGRDGVKNSQQRKDKVSESKSLWVSESSDGRFS